MTSSNTLDAGKGFLSAGAAGETLILPAAHPDKPKGSSSKSLSRREFIRTASGTLLAGTVLGAACEDERVQGVRAADRFAATFTEGERGWGPDWLNVRYQSSWRVAGGAGVLEAEPVEPKAVQEGKEVALYMVQPVIVTSFAAADASVKATIEVSGDAAGGVIARASYDESYAILVEGSEILLCRYDVLDRTTLDSAALPGRGPFEVELDLSGDQIAGRARRVGGGDVRVAARDGDPLPAGYAGVLLNPRSVETASALTVMSFTVEGELTTPRPRFAYRFAGAVLPASGTVYRARLTARTVVPERIGFDIATDAEFTDARRVAPSGPRGSLGSVDAWAGELEPGTRYYWRPFAAVDGARVWGPPASFRTPPAAGAGVRFAYGCCTSGRVTDYSSFRRAASFEPEFYLHSGDWGYADLTSMARRADHFHARWMRLLRDRNVGELLHGSPLLFWQDDHDYQADNGWSGTVQKYAVDAFDELHANPSDDYFDFRWGDLHVWCLDCRLHATDPEAPDGPAKSRIGAAQKQWLMDGMRASDAPVQVVASPMVFRNKPDDDPGWHNVYEHERDQLLGFFAGLERTVLILSGDSHGQRLLHHFEFGDLFEVNSSGTDFPGGNQGNNDPEHTLVNIATSGFAVVDLDPEGPGRSITARVISTGDGQTLFAKSLPVAG